MRPKEFRLHHKERLKRTRKRYWDGGVRKAAQQINMIVRTPAICSCWMCGNPRKWWKQRTIKELSDIEFFKLGKTYEL